MKDFVVQKGNGEEIIIVGDDEKIEVVPKATLIADNNSQHEGYYGMVYRGEHAMERRFLQVLSREIIITSPDGQHQTHLNVGLSTSGGHYKATIDPAHPHFNLDIGEKQGRGIEAPPETPYYSDLYRVQVPSLQSNLTTDLSKQKGTALAVLPGSGMIDDEKSAMFDKPTWGTEGNLFNLFGTVVRDLRASDELKERYYKTGAVVTSKARMEAYLVDTQTQKPIHQMSFIASSEMTITETYGRDRALYDTTKPFAITYVGHQPVAEFQPEVAAAIERAQDEQKFTRHFVLPEKPKPTHETAKDEKKDKKDLDTTQSEIVVTDELKSQPVQDKPLERSMSRLLLQMGVSPHAAKEKLAEEQVDIKDDENLDATVSKGVTKAAEVVQVELKDREELDMTQAEPQKAKKDTAVIQTALKDELKSVEIPSVEVTPVISSDEQKSGTPVALPERPQPTHAIANKEKDEKKDKEDLDTTQAEMVATDELKSQPMQDKPLERSMSRLLLQMGVSPHTAKEKLAEEKEDKKDEEELDTTQAESKGAKKDTAVVQSDSKDELKTVETPSVEVTPVTNPSQEQATVVQGSGTPTITHNTYK